MGKYFRHYVDRKHVSMIFNIFSMIHKTGRVEKKLPLDFIHKDGSSRMAEGSIALIRAENGSPMGFRGILRDITDSNKKKPRSSTPRKKPKENFKFPAQYNPVFWLPIIQARKDGRLPPVSALPGRSAAISDGIRSWRPMPHL